MLSATARPPFTDPRRTADGNARARVHLKQLDTLWFNTGTLCNLTCANCYIESSPRNDRLVYLTLAEFTDYLDEIDALRLTTRQIGFTGGEPFMNPDLVPMINRALDRGFQVLLLTNAMRPMMKCAAAMKHWPKAGEQLEVRVSVDHFRPEIHEEERGKRSWQPMIDGLKWLSAQGFNVTAAGRTRWGEDEAKLRTGFGKLFAEQGIDIDASDPTRLVLFPEMDERAPTPEITTACWEIVGIAPDDLMCANSRMVVKPKGHDKPRLMACTLLAYDDRFEVGKKLADTFTEVALNHPHCSKFCVLGGGSCTKKD